MSDFRLQPCPGTIAITTLLEFCSWLLWKGQEGIKMGSIVEAAIYEYIGKFFLIFVVVPVGIMVLGYIICIIVEVINEIRKK